MTTTLTSKGQVTIPKPVRDYLGLRPGSAVEFEIAAGGKATVRAVDPKASHDTRSRARKVRGILKTGRSTKELMELLRDYSADAHDPGFGDA